MKVVDIRPRFLTDFRSTFTLQQRAIKLIESRSLCMISTAAESVNVHHSLLLKQLAGRLGQSTDKGIEVTQRVATASVVFRVLWQIVRNLEP